MLEYHSFYKFTGSGFVVSWFSSQLLLVSRTFWATTVIIYTERVVYICSFVQEAIYRGSLTFVQNSQSSVTASGRGSEFIAWFILLAGAN